MNNRPGLMLRMVAVFAVAMLVLPGGAAAATSKTVQARHGSLLLSITVHQRGKTVIARASLINRGRRAFTYYGACAPPILQIQAHDTAGRHVYGWRPATIRCTALSQLHLNPGARLGARAKFRISKATVLYALVPQGQTGTLFCTRTLTVRPR